MDGSSHSFGITGCLLRRFDEVASRTNAVEVDQLDYTDYIELYKLNSRVCRLVSYKLQTSYNCRYL